MYIHSSVRITDGKASQANLKLFHKGIEISIAFDDSCGTFEHLKRIDLRVYDARDGKSEKDITKYITEDNADYIYPTCLADIVAVTTKIDELIELGKL